MSKRPTVFAVDFDGTLCSSVYPGIGEPNKELIAYLIKKRKQGDKVILWTCREGNSLISAVAWCAAFGLEFDAVNENIPEMIKHFGTDPRKIAYDVLIDDKAKNLPKFHVPFTGEEIGK